MLLLRLFPFLVTPFVGVWIEIPQSIDSGITFTSLPSWECGLKCRWGNTYVTPVPSLPSWECGLKLCKWGGWWYSTAVTPFVGVWIEINVNRIKRTYIKSLPSWECGLKYTTVARGDGEQRSLPSWECGLKSDNGHCRLSRVSCHSLRGSVD